MKYLFQLLIIFSFSLVGEILRLLIPIPIPASIYGIILLFTALELKWLKVSHIRETSNFLIATMPIMFLPAAVGVLTAWDYVRVHLWQYCFVMFLSTFVVMATAGIVTQWIIRRQDHNHR